MIFRMVYKFWTDLYFVLPQITRLLDGRTDRQADAFLVASPHWSSVKSYCTEINVTWCDEP